MTTHADKTAQAMEAKEKFEENVRDPFSDLCEEDEKEFIERFKVDRDAEKPSPEYRGSMDRKTCGFYIRKNKYPVRVQAFEKDDGSEFFQAHAVPFVGY